MTVYRCQDTLESVFTAIYRAYEEKRDHEDTLLCLTDDPILFSEDVTAEPDEERARKVMNTLKRRFGNEDCASLCMALAAGDMDKAQAVYRTVVKGLRTGSRPCAFRSWTTASCSPESARKPMCLLSSCRISRTGCPRKTS